MRMKELKWAEFVVRILTHTHTHTEEGVGSYSQAVCMSHRCCQSGFLAAHVFGNIKNVSKLAYGWQGK